MVERIFFCSKVVEKNFQYRGRVVGILDDGFVLQDEGGRVDLAWEGEVRVGDIVSVMGRKELVEQTVDELRATTLGGALKTADEIDTTIRGGGGMVAVSVDVLVPCEDDFFIRKGDPNYRKMVLDRLIMERMKKRAEILDFVRGFFKERGFLEVETPSLVRLPGMEPYLDVFETEFVSEAQGNAGGRGDDGGQSNAGGQANAGGRGNAEGQPNAGWRERMFLVTSPEYAMKKLLVGGAEKIFQICKSFRNKETDSTLHNPEFTLLEWYRAYADYGSIMQDTEELVCALAVAVNGAPVIRFGGEVIDVSTPWPRLKVKDAFLQHAGISHEVFLNEERLRAAVRAKGYRVSDEAPFDELFFVVFMNEIEPKLGMEKAVILYEYPAEMAALSRVCEGDARYAERFEAYVGGVELCNAFSELNDWKEQARRLAFEREERRKMGKVDYDVDSSFIEALKFGMPPSGGNALGIDRLVMLLLDVSDIRDVMFFPQRDL